MGLCIFLYVSYVLLYCFGGEIMTIADEFLSKYKELEKLITNKYNLNNDVSAILYLSKQKEFKNKKDSLDYIRQIRNFLSHESMIDGEYGIMPNKKLINMIEDIIKMIKSPVMACDVCVKINDIEYKELCDNVLTSILSLKHGKYSHLPILERGVVVGVFSKTTLFNYLLAGKEFTINKEDSFNDIKEYIRLESKLQDRYAFAKYNDSLFSIKELFERIDNHGKRVTIVFLTNNGLKTEKLMGMITPYDVISTSKIGD